MPIPSVPSDMPMKRKTSPENARAEPDVVLSSIADYALNYKVQSKDAIETSRWCLLDSMACALDALSVPECNALLGPLVPGTIVPNGARVPGTTFELDPATAAFSFGSMIRWSDFNDAFTAAEQGSHPSDNFAGILMLADHISRRRVSMRRVPLLMQDVLVAAIKAYEIQGCLSFKNDFYQNGIDHNLLTQVASAAVLTQMLGGTQDQIVNAVSNAWMNCSLAAYRYAPNTGSRKGWGCADASFQAVRLAMMAMKGEMGYPSVLSAKPFGFYEARFDGKAFDMPQPFGEFVIQHSMFKFAAAGMHSQSAIECALLLHPLVKDRLDQIERIEISSHRALMDIMHKVGPLYNPADRDHCAQYVIAVGLIKGTLFPEDLNDDFAANPSIDELREKMVMIENPDYSKDFFDSAKGSSANAVQVWFKDGSSSQKVEIEYPLGHPRRRAEAAPALQAKFRSSLERRFSQTQSDKIIARCVDGDQLKRMPVNEFVDMFIVNSIE